MNVSDRVAVGLLERGDELATLTALLDSARGGDGSLVLVEGPAGIGKTSLLDACAGAAADSGMLVLRVRGDEVLMESSFAAVRELLWRQVTGDPTAFEGAARLALVVDDAHWLDAASARFLVYLGQRVQSLPAALIVGLRRGEAASMAGLGAALEGLAAGVLRPAALSEEASSVLVRAVLGPRAGEELWRSCHRATGGNPFYLRELAAALKARSGRAHDRGRGRGRGRRAARRRAARS